MGHFINCSSAFICSDIGIVALNSDVHFINSNKSSTLTKENFINFFKFITFLLICYRISSFKFKSNLLCTIIYSIQCLVDVLFKDYCAIKNWSIQSLNPNLINCIMKVILNGSTSRSFCINMAVPQGFTLDLLFFFNFLMSSVPDSLYIPMTQLFTPILIVSLIASWSQK